MCTSYTRVLSSCLNCFVMWFKKILAALLFTGLFQSAYADLGINLHSPDGNIQLNVLQRTDGSLVYRIYYKDKTVIAASGLGLKFKSPDVLLEKFDLVPGASRLFDSGDIVIYNVEAIWHKP